MKAILTCMTEIKIPFHDVDSMQITWHGNYLRYFEIARCDLLDKLDYNYCQMLESGYSWPIVDLHIKYVKPSLFDQKILVTASLVEWENRIRINYVITDANTGKRLTKGYTIQAAVDNDTQELCFVTPKIFQEKVLPLLER
ncbi:acyl-CoA thioesterase [Parashewanella curva]|uniref:Acyl-CoA thioesterase n=1 Tax=Parashewanella curva TaxID=2338552 RepID=A0A3L8Q140_9GAMM|nr:acyl-CoA thioesterase [Parashewanella curva]RLV60528.1 acyl-CoA thioesterase [Parashewanella curva]